MSNLMCNHPAIVVCTSDTNRLIDCFVPVAIVFLTAINNQSRTSNLKFTMFGTRSGTSQPIRFRHWNIDTSGRTPIYHL